MARLILDTTILVQSERGGRSWYEELPDDADIAVAAVTIAELLVGAELADARRARHRRAFVAGLHELVEVEDYTGSTAVEHARLLAHVRRSGEPRGAHDLIIAATAIANSRTLVTADSAARFDELPGLDVQLVT
ncbi:MAG: PIN domain-containing protein [Pseudonocardia sp.]